MDRIELIKSLNERINFLNKEKEKYPYHENIDKLINDYKAIRKALKNEPNPDLITIEGAGRWHFSAYFSIDNEDRLLRTTIMDYISLYGKDLKHITGIKRQSLYAGKSSIQADYITI